MPEPYDVHIPLSVLRDAVTHLRRTTFTAAAILDLQSLINRYIRREPGPGMTEVRAQALYDAICAYRLGIRDWSECEPQWERVLHVLKVIEKGGTL